MEDNSIVLILALGYLVLLIVGWWVVFEKAGKPGWMSIIPILNVIALLDIAGKPWWWLLLLFIPIVGVIIVFVVLIDFARAFGQGVLFGVLMVFFTPIMMLILAFGNATYVGSSR